MFQKAFSGAVLPSVLKKMQETRCNLRELNITTWTELSGPWETPEGTIIEFDRHRLRTVRNFTEQGLPIVVIGNSEIDFKPTADSRLFFQVRG